MPDLKVSLDLEGHLADDGKSLIIPFKANTVDDVFNAHNQPGTPLDQQCKCAHCQEHRDAK